MKLIIKQAECFALPEAFYDMLTTELCKVRVKSDITNIVLNFRDKGYSADNGGFHPVEIRLHKLNDNWQLVYVTDFAYHGCPYPELVKEIDICFTRKQVYHLYGGWLNKQAGSELIQLFIGTFIEYHNMGVYVVEISTE
jgi:hypothetical protein